MKPIECIKPLNQILSKNISLRGPKIRLIKSTDKNFGLDMSKSIKSKLYISAKY